MGALLSNWDWHTTDTFKDLLQGTRYHCGYARFVTDIIPHNVWLLFSFVEVAVECSSIYDLFPQKKRKKILVIQTNVS